MSEASPGRRLRVRASSVRVRITAAATVLVAIALILAAMAMVALLHRSLIADVRAAARLRAKEVATSSVAIKGGTIRGGDAEKEFVQVVAGSGRVVAATSNVGGDPAIVALQPDQSREVRGLSFENDPFLVVASGGPAGDGSRTILVGRSLETVTESTSTVVRLLVIGVPLLLVLLAATTWGVVGRSLAPVEGIRAEVAAISSTELHRRVPDPPGEDEVSRLASTMNEMLARLQEGQERQRRFVSDAAHELRSPVAAIRQHAEVALAHPDSATAPELAEVVSQEDARLERIVDDLLLLSQMDEGRARPQLEPVDLDDVVLEEAAHLRGSTNLRIDIAGVSAGRIAGVPSQLTRLVRNLGENAARHARSTVALSVGEDTTETILRVEDDGPGIAASDRRRVFDRFVRLDEARDRDSGGSGLGLAIVAEVAFAHGGWAVVVDSALGGTGLEVRFPRLRD